MLSGLSVSDKAMYSLHSESMGHEMVGKMNFRPTQMKDVLRQAQQLIEQAPAFIEPVDVEGSKGVSDSIPNDVQSKIRKLFLP